MRSSPSDILREYRNKAIDRNYTLNLLISLIEHIEDNFTRKECLEILPKLGIEHENLFKLLENLVISDLDEDIRYTAIKVLKKCYIRKSLKPLGWAFKNEKSFKCIMEIIDTLEIVDNEQSRRLLRDFIKELNSEFFNSLGNQISYLEYFSSNKLSSILRNYYILEFLKNKFPKLEYLIDKGVLIYLDFSKVDLKITNWQQRRDIQDLNVLKKIDSLMQMREIELFSNRWASNNEFSYNCQINLIKNILKLRFDLVQRALVKQISSIQDLLYFHAIKDIIRKQTYLENLSNNELAEILIYFISISYLKKKFPKISYKVKAGLIKKLYIENQKIISFLEALCQLNSLEFLIIKNCSIYRIPESINKYKRLKRLDLEGNNIKLIPNSIGELKSLKRLILKRNKLKELPESIGLLSKLEYLDL
ncbi:MAG: leucine-rich repeat domain-containing protein [Promethearchaeota archaeon]